jgi:uncharacterized integral membrane protein
MLSLLRWTVYLPLALLIIWFALANRGWVTISLDPSQTGEFAQYNFEAPLFLVVMASMAIGVFVGGLQSWVSHRSVRRAARLARTEAAKAQSEVEKLRQAALANLQSAAGAKRTAG